MLKEMIAKRDIPEFLDREKMKDILLREEYGYLPDISYEVTVSEPEILEKRYVAGTACHSKVNFTVKSELGSHTFKVDRLLHTDGKKHPFFVFLSNFTEVPNKYYPLEEIADRGFSVLSVGYKDVTSDDKDFTNGLSKVFYKDGEREDNSAGKIMLWSFALRRILDYAESIPELDLENVGVVGHSRLGKTALVTGMMDERFKFVFSNNSGCSGAAITKGGMGHLGIVGEYQPGESIRAITKNFPYWFCKNYIKYAEDNYPSGFDQHYLLATIAPRFLYVASASMDQWADPDSEFLGCVKATEIYEKMGYKGLISEDRLPCVGEIYNEGRVGYHRRYGLHFLSRYDWNRYMDFMELHKDEK